MPEVIQNCEYDHSGEHRDILLHAHRGARYKLRNQRLCHRVGNKVAHKNVHNEAENIFHASFPALKGEIFVQKIAEYTAEKVVRCRGQPVVKVQAVVKHEHYACAEQGVHDADKHKAHRRAVK